MPGAVETLPILTYHSISNEPGPTSIAPEIFRAQMEEIAAAGVDVVSLDEVACWVAGQASFERRTVAITFDDAFSDFAGAAFPVLERLKFPATVFVPTAIVGGAENWIGANDNARKLMDWEEIGALARRGVAFGSHTKSHADLTGLDGAELDEELSASRKELEARLARPAPHFAPPYGRSNEAVRSAIMRHYSLSVGVRLDEARRSSPIGDLPRIEMFYYRDLGQWRAFLDGRGGAYLQIRRAARGVRETLSGMTRQRHY
ncbi:MAG: hypothetical protein A3E78_00800 [Alphaproteobacteria bacterium RIFCSPHIGHO2_12_FULL_63_12]|nr:MAG: hypothetical protein A3E78_00800 [Alphaproteobacteria bacterium RIFCSPHIGHO2_12_FULL_63_12]